MTVPKRIFVVPAEGHDYVIGQSHPIDGVLRPYGSFWTYDAYTCAMLRDGTIIATGEEDTSPRKDVGPEAIMQQRRVSATRPRMRIHNPPTVK